MREFIHYKTHSQYSICEGAVKISELAEYCKKNKIFAAGISDTNNLSGALEFSNELSKAGTQPVIGNQLNIKLNFNNQYTIGKVSIIAKDAKGYENMFNLSSKSYLELKENEDINCLFDDLVKFSEGLIILAGGTNSLIYKLILNNNDEQVDFFLNEIKRKIKDDLYIEIQRHKEVNDNLIEKNYYFLAINYQYLLLQHMKFFILKKICTKLTMHTFV